MTTATDPHERVIHVSTVHPRTDTRIAIKQMRTLLRAGLTVKLIVADGNGDSVSGDVAILDIGASRGRIRRALHAGPRALLAALTRHPTILHFHDPELLPFAALFSLFTRTKFIYDAHEDVPRQILGKAYLPRRLRPIISRIAEAAERVLSPRMDAIVTVTPTIHARFARFHNRVVTVANFPILEEFHAASTAARDVKPASVCYVGGIAEVRGIHQMVHAMELVRTGVRLQLAGNVGGGRLRSELAKRPGWVNVDELGFLDRGGIAAVLGTSTAGLVTLLPIANYVDAYPVKLFEYMGAGIPVIASDFPLWRQIVEGADCGLCVDPTDPAAIAAAIDFLVENPDRAREMGRNGRAAVELQYNWERESMKLLDLYRELLG